jgi:hypothetical protein
MSNRAYNILITVMVILIGGCLTLIGYLLLRLPWVMETIWWAPLALGIVCILGGLVSIGFDATQPTKIPCPYCREKIVPKVRGLSGHLHLSRLDED